MCTMPRLTNRVGPHVCGVRDALSLQLPIQKFRKMGGEKMCWPHLRVRSVSRGGPGGHCRYPADRIPPHTSFKSRQRAGRASTRYHVSCSSGPCLPIKMDSGTAMCPTTLNLTSLSRWAPALPRVPRPCTSPPDRDGIWCHHVSRGSRPCHPTEESSGAVTCPMASDPTSMRGRALVLPRISRPSVGYGPQV
jgi:hypothetical protein